MPVRAPHSTGYKIRRGKSGQSSSITIPPSIVRCVPEGIAFTYELTEDGILMRPLLTPPSPVPSWARDPQSQ